jgi:hypothetical protein
MAQKVASGRRANIGDISRADRDLMEIDADVDTVLNENFGMMGHLAKVYTLVRPAHLCGGMRGDASTGGY